MKKYYYAIFGVFMLAMMSIPLVAQAQTESYYQDLICEEYRGVKEAVNVDKTRVDCLTSPKNSALSIEVDFAKKWYQCLTQAMYYAMLRGNQAACVLIVEDYQKDMKYVERARELVIYNKLPVFVDIYKEEVP